MSKFHQNCLTETFDSSIFCRLREERLCLCDAGEPQIALADDVKTLFMVLKKETMQIVIHTKLCNFLKWQFKLLFIVIL